MTTYLGTAFTPDMNHPITLPFCSPTCRQQLADECGSNDYEASDDDHYEFDETCANCGALIPACAPYTASELLEMLRADHVARHCPGCEICR